MDLNKIKEELETISYFKPVHIVLYHTHLEYNYLKKMDLNSMDDFFDMIGLDNNLKQKALEDLKARFDQCIRMLLFISYYEKTKIP